jgi:NADH-quinone oxidoreductase subunit L
MAILTLLWLLPTLPLIGFLILAIFGSKFSKRAIAFIGVGTVGLSALLAILIGIAFLKDPLIGNQYVQNLWTWFTVSGFTPTVALYLDPLSLIFTFVITFVGFLIHLYSAEFMENDEGYARFFAYMNLFIGSMLVLVWANDLLLLYMGWEGVGLCSFLLIGFWYKDPVNGAAALKAFVVTRVGDTLMIVGLFLLLTSFGTLTVNTILAEASTVWDQNSSIAFWGAFLLLGGALGKSAQVPLQVWLPDAMAGPSPVSALIHAATMVTAGVYLITRMHALFDLASAALALVASIGAVTLIIGGFSALVQNDIKRVLVYSTISQIGYMFLAMGLGAWSTAVFHFFIHAFFKSLLFLGAGAIILALNQEHDLHKMGGLRKKMPVVFWTFLCGSGALAALPLITAGFYSKDPIIEYAMASDKGNTWLWLAAIVGAFITSIYTFRMVFLAFFGMQKTKLSYYPKNRIKIPLVVLAVFSIFIGFIELPKWMGNFTPFSNFLNLILPQVVLKSNVTINEGIVQIITVISSLLGVYIAWIIYKNPKRYALSKNTWIYTFLQKGWGFDWLYDHVLVRPIVWLAKVDQGDIIDKFYLGLASLNIGFNKILKRSQNGSLRWYAMGIAFGALLTLTLILFL